nr:uncharacterized protein LOC112013142 [Quercus suber]
MLNRYSGVSWCWSGLPDDIKLVTRWQTRFNFTSDSAKTPTELCYDTTDGKPAWGFDIPANKEAIAWFKLLLVDQDKLPEKYRESKQLMRARKLAADAAKTPVDLVADYLRLLWKHTLDSIKRERGDVAVDGSPFRVWLTVPAIWDAISCGRMREAAEKAGILAFRSAGPTVLDLVAEPEAAALAVLDDFRKAPNVQDIISYTVLNVDPVGLQECVEGQGALCGAVRIDEAFLSMVKANLGEPRWEKTSTEDRKIMMYNEWENGITQGEIITHTDPVSFKFFLWISKESQLEDMMRVDVFENDEQFPPGRQTDKVRRLLTLSFRGNTSFDDLPTWTNPMGIVFRKLDFAVGMYSTGTSLKWRVTVDGVVQGEQDVRIQHDWTSSTRNTGVHNDSVSLGLEVMRI